ncbi:flagellar protein FlaG [Desulfogranum marinum]|uniref:flagellar protein FlaG n=1 Tax=Desulfogranum marinum TaxID=453220 RepID=UPI0029C8E889|nr:flagellar protein FlaG [Desulfogranum marinum]
MMIEAVGATTVSPPRANEPVQKVEQEQQQVKEQPQADSSDSNIQQEELINQIKSLTEDGVYSVRFERDDTANELVVKIVDHETDEIIRQIPSEELLNLSKHLQDLSGNLVNTVS